MESTGCEVADGLIGYYKGLTVVYGSAASGKTTLAKLAAIELSKKGKVLYLDTENGFNTDRLKQLTNDFKRVIGNVMLVKANSFFKQHIAIKDIGSLKNLSLAVVDTIGANYRVYVKKDYKKANLILGKQMSVLKELSRRIPVIVITQVYSDMKSGLLNPTGGKVVMSKADIIIRMEKNPRRMIVEKPLKKDALFEIKEKGIVGIN